MGRYPVASTGFKHSNASEEINVRDSFGLATYMTRYKTMQKMSS